MLQSEIVAALSVLLKMASAVTVIGKPTGKE